MGAMPHHRFTVGQTVVAPSGVRDALIPPGPYVIVRLLPPVGSEPHYRVKSAVDGHERALLEGQIRRNRRQRSNERRRRSRDQRGGKG